MFATDVNVCEVVKHSRWGHSQRKRFTLDGDDSLESRLVGICETVLHGVQHTIPTRQLEALFLGGGYGRGEGGVLKTAEGDQPYNDVEFYVFIRGNRFLNRRRFAPALNELAHEITKAAGVEVEFHIISSAELRRSRPSMFYYDLVVGHQQLYGDETVLRGCNHHRDPKRLPPAEATRLLMNRGTGLLLAREKLSHDILSIEDRDFIARNVAKAQLALGDAVLTVCDRYHWSCCERNRRLAKLDHAVNEQSWFNLICDHHESGVEFKLHPYRNDASAAELRSQHESAVQLMLQVWLWTEGQRLQIDFPSARQYARSTVDKCPETNPWRNRLLNSRIFGPAILMSPSSRRHPRERIFNALSILLWDQEHSAELLFTLLRADSNASSTGQPPDSLDAYQKIWERVR